MPRLKSLIVFLTLLTGSVLQIVPVLARPSVAPVEIVTNTNNAGPGSLRQAILDVEPGGTIKFSPTLSGSTIYLASTISIVEDLTIDGETYNITISGDSDKNGVGNVSIFNIERGTVTLNHLTITKGKSAVLAGGINNRSHGSLIVNNCTFMNNETMVSGGAIYSVFGSLTINNSTFFNNIAARDGGGIQTDLGKLTVSNSTFSNNIAKDSQGGALSISSADQAVISNSSFTGNSATGLGAGIANSHSPLWISNSSFSNNNAQAGGGIVHGYADMWIYNSTFSGNSAGLDGGGIRAEFASVAVYNNTFIENSAGRAGGGIQIYYGQLNIFNTIVANNVEGEDCYTLFSTVTADINNFFGDKSCNGIGKGNPKLGPLQNNGGRTKTRALLPGSPAINAGNNSLCPVIDQRDMERLDGACDIGAYEVGAIPTVGPILTNIGPDKSGLNNIRNFTLILNGARFTPNSIVRWNGDPRTTNLQLINPFQLRVDIPSTDVDALGKFDVTVFDPADGGRESSAKAFTVVEMIYQNHIPVILK